MPYLKTLFFLSILAVAVACAENIPISAKPSVNAEPQINNNDEIVAKGKRLLGIGVNEGSIGFEKAIKAAREAGLQVVELSVQWDDVEKQPGKYSNQWLDIANAYYPAMGVKLLISFNPIDTNSIRVPADLRDKPLDDPKVIARYNRAVDYVLGRLKATDLIGFVIGNEIDATLGDDARKWAQYARFFKATSEYVRKQRRGVPVGTKVMLQTLVGANTDLSAAVNAHADVIMATYYPLGDKFWVKDISSVRHDIGKLATLPGNKPIFLAEVGCPSSEYINSSMTKQSQFIHEIFKAWDKYRERIQFMNFIWLHDISKAKVESYTKYYGLASKEFTEYLGTLGFRTHDGKNKLAFKTLYDQAKLRGW